MPKASKPKTASARKDPIAKPTMKDIPKEKTSSSPPPKPSSKTRKLKDTTSSTPKENPTKTPTEKPTKPPKEKVTKDPKASHLYTDDNPSTTIHGTGFKDAATAHSTLTLIASRSLTYQFQTVNTLFHRAKHHPALKKGPTESNADIRAAMAVFEEWIEKTYPASKAKLRVDGGFKPLLSKTTVAKYLPTIHQLLKDGDEALTFASVYTELGRNKRLGNVLVDDSKPTEADWEVRRYEALCELVPEGKEEFGDWEAGELWVEGQEAEKEPSEVHARLIAWAWSPVGERRLK